MRLDLHDGQAAMACEEGRAPLFANLAAVLWVGWHLRRSGVFLFCIQGSTFSTTLPVSHLVNACASSARTVARAAQYDTAASLCPSAACTVDHHAGLYWKDAAGEGVDRKDPLIRPSRSRMWLGRLRWSIG